MSKLGFGFVPSIVEIQPPMNGIDYDGIKDAVIEAEGYGFDSVWLVDHVNLLDSNPYCKSEIFESLTLLSALSEVTSMLLGTIVLCNPFRNPAILAKMASTIDIISNGRLVLGIGTGWHKNEFEEYGIPFGSFKERHDMLVDALNILKGSWTEPRFTYSGRQYSVKEMVLEPKPVQRPHPPIMIGGMGNTILRTTAKYADWWNGTGINVEEFKEKLAILDGFCGEIGRPTSEIKKSLFYWACLSQDQEEAKRNKKLYSGDGISETHLFGTPEELVSKIGEFADAGLEYLMVLFPDMPTGEGMRLFAGEVMPEFG